MARVRATDQLARNGNGQTRSKYNRCRVKYKRVFGESESGRKDPAELMSLLLVRPLRRVGETLPLGG
jgi:hypothetical protein